MLDAFLPNPLHPAVVHFPVVLAVLAPIFAIGAVIAIRRGTRVRTAWGITAALMGALVASAWLSLETGEAQEDVVEPVVAEAPFEAHEESAEAFMAIALVVFGTSLFGFLPRQAGAAARVVAAAGTLVVTGAAYRVGHSGGALVYQHGAASAYANPGVPTGTEAAAAARDDDR